ncbi:NAD-dependent epimerase/dehydratase family protein [Pueribacillus sp. YX66]|uniref:NAD-dependent epimerase/dehydratase family protein n=1 Tax=Pueribacillus sp. YX66 TaxID=3229242 RepID=UPI00358D936F
MKVVIAGGTGFVGRALSNLLLQKGHDVIVLTRNKNKQSDARITYIEWLNNESIEYEKLNDVDAIINLAGESINNRWTTTMKEHILTSRLKATESIHQLIKKLSKKPNVYIQAQP